MPSYNYTNPQGQSFTLDVDEELQPDQVYQRFVDAGVAQAQAPQATTDAGYLSQLGSALSIGAGQMASGVKATFNAATGDIPDTAAAMAQMGALQKEQQANLSAEDIALNEAFARNKAEYDQARGILPTIGALSGYVGSIASQPGAAFKQAIQSAPNAAISAGTGLAGYALGGLVGAGAGIETGPGAVLTGIAGAAAGGAISNSLMEAGPAIYDILNERTNGAASSMTADQITQVLQQNPDIMSEGLKTGAIRGSVIGVIEGLGMKGAGRLMSIPERAAARAVQKTLIGAGVDVASKEAVESALLDPALKNAVSAAAKTAQNEFTSAGNLARLAGASGIEIGASGAGEVGAQVATGQEIDPTAAVQEMMGEVGLSIPVAAVAKGLELARTPQALQTPIQQALAREINAIPTNAVPPQTEEEKRAGAEAGNPILVDPQGNTAAVAPEMWNEAIKRQITPPVEAQAATQPSDVEARLANLMRNPGLNAAVNTADSIVTTAENTSSDVSQATTAARNIIQGVVDTPQPREAPTELPAVTPSPAMEQPEKPSQILTGSNVQTSTEMPVSGESTAISPSEAPISEQPSPNLAPRANITVARRPARKGRDTSERDAWDEKYGGTHNEDGTPYQPTILDEVFAKVRAALAATSFDENIDSIGVDNGVEARTALEQLLNDGWVWDETANKMVNTANPSETPALGLRRIRSKKKSTPQPQPIETAPDAIQEQITDEGLLRQERPEMELQGLGEGNAQPQEVAAEGQIQEEVAPPITPQGTPTPATEGKVTPGGVAIERDVTKPEQMTPEEFIPVGNSVNQGIFKSKKEASARLTELEDSISKSPQMLGILSEFNLIPGDAYQVAKDARGRWTIGATHKHRIALASRENRPVSAAAVDAYKITLPEGYVRQGDLYVFSPQTTTVAAPTETAAPSAKEAAVASVVQQPVEGSIPTVEQESAITAIESTEKTDVADAAIQEVIDENTDLNPITDEMVDSSLSPVEKREAAIILGKRTWNDSKELFKQRMADWMAGANETSKKLIKFFKSVASRARLLLAASIGLSMANSTSDANLAESNQFKAFRIPVSSVLNSKPARPKFGGLPDMNIGIPEQKIPLGAGGINLSARRKIDAKGKSIPADVVKTAQWALDTKDTEGYPFIVTDKVGAAMYFFDENGVLLKKSPVLVGKNVGDFIGNTDAGRITPSGRFEIAPETDATYGNVFSVMGTDMVDSETGDLVEVAIHRLALHDPSENRPQRIATKTPLDNRISWGCLNLDNKVMDWAVRNYPLGGVIYILPETAKGRSAFAPFNKSNIKSSKLLTKSSNVDRSNELNKKEDKKLQAAQKQREELGLKTLNSLIEKTRTNVVQGTVKSSDANQAVAILNKSGAIPNVLFTWIGTSKDFLADPANRARYPETWRAVSNNNNAEGWSENGQPIVFTDNVGVSDLDRNLAKLQGTTPEIAAVRRVILHENIHKGMFFLNRKDKMKLFEFLHRLYSPEELDQLAKSYDEYSDWRINQDSYFSIIEESMTRDFDSMAEIPRDGIWAEFMQFLRDIWQKITGKTSEPTLKNYKDVFRLIRNSLKNSEAANADRLKNGGAVRMSMSEFISNVTPEQDAAYAKAVADGDMATAQRMVDEAAWDAGYQKLVVHQTHQTGIREFDRNRGGAGVYEWDNIGIWTTTEDTPTVYGQVKMRLLGKMENPKRYRDLDAYDEMLREYLRVAYREVLFALNSTEIESDQLIPLFRKEIARLAKEDGIEGSSQSKKYQAWLKSRFPGAEGFRQFLKSQGYDGIQIDGAFWDGEIQTVRIFFEPNQLKSADPVTYDESGNVIPLSRRFQSASNDIRFSKVEYDSPNEAAFNSGAKYETYDTSIRPYASQGYGSQRMEGVSTGDNSPRAQAIRKAVSESNWNELSPTQRAKALEEFGIESIQSRYSFDATLLPVRVTNERTPKNRPASILSAGPSPAITIQFDTSGLADLLSGDAVTAFANVFDMAQEEVIHAAQHINIYNRWKSSNSTDSVGLYELKHYTSMINEVAKIAGDELRNGNPAVANVFTNAWNLYNPNDQASDVNDAIGKIKSAPEAAAFAMELSRMMLQMQRQDFTTETGWMRFVEAMKAMLADITNALRTALAMAKNGQVGKRLQDEISEVNALINDLESASQPMASKVEYDSPNEAAFNSGAEVARNADYDERDKAVRSTIREAYDLAPKDNGPSVPLDQLFDIAKQSMPDLTEGEFSQILQDLYEDSGALLQAGESPFIVTTPDGKRAGSVIIVSSLPTGVMASTIDPESTSTKEFTENIKAINNGTLKAAFDGVQFVNIKPVDHIVKPNKSYEKIAIDYVDGLMGEGQSIEQIATSIMTPMFFDSVGASNDVKARQALTSEVLRRVTDLNGLSNTRLAAKRLEKLEDLLGSFWQGLGTESGGNLGQRAFIIGSPRYSWMFLKNTVKKELKKRRDNILNVQFGNDNATSFTQNSYENADMANQIAADENVNAAENDAEWSLIKEGVEILEGEAKSIWQRMAQLLRRFAFYARRKTMRAANAKASLTDSERNELNAILQMSDEEAAKAEAKDFAEFIALGKRFLGEESDADTPEKKTVRKKREKMVEVAKKRADKGLTLESLESDSAFTKMLREINQARRGAEVPLKNPIPWRKLLSQKAKTVEEYRQRIFDAISANEELKSATPEQKARLADLFTEAWESNRKRILDGMQERLIREKEAKGELSKKGAEALQEQRMRMVEDINLGIFDNDEIAKIMAEKFGVKSEFTDAEREKIESLIEILQDEKLNRVKRNKAAYELLETLSAQTDIPISKLLANFWVSSVLSGMNTVFSIGMSVFSGMGELTTTLYRIFVSAFSNQKQLPSEVAAAFKTLARVLSATPRQANRAWQYLVTGDQAFLDPTMNDALKNMDWDSIGKNTQLAEQMAKSDKTLQKVMGLFMRTVSRLLTALDLFNSGLTKEGSLSLVFRQLNLDPAKIEMLEKKSDLKAYKAQVIRDYFNNVQPKNLNEKALVESYAMAEMMKALDELGSVSENADQMAMQGAMTLDPSGVGGYGYRLVKSMMKSAESGTDKLVERNLRKWDEAQGASDKTEAFVKLAISYIFQFAAYNAANLVGVRFARFAGNKFNQSLSFLPIIGALRLYEAEFDADRIRGKEAFTDMIKRNQLTGVMAAAIGYVVLKAIAEEPDDEKRGAFINGGWSNLTPEKKQQKLASGQKEYTLGFGDTVINYGNWPGSGIIAAIGGLSDLIRFSPEQWSEKTVSDKLMSATASGVFSALEVPALSQFQELFGSSLSSKDPNEQKLTKFARVIGNYAGGFVPRILKDIDYAQDPNLRKYETLWEKIASHIPVYRRYEGKEYYDILGQQIQRNIYPGSREFMTKPTDPAYKVLGALHSRGIWLTPANAEHRMVGKGARRRSLTQEEADNYSLETGKGYKQMLMRYGQRALQMPTERAKAFLLDKADDVRDMALKKVYRGYTPAS